jgi:hypothetical protein
MEMKQHTQGPHNNKKVMHMPKKILWTTALTTLASAFLFTACSTPAGNVGQSLFNPPTAPAITAPAQTATANADGPVSSTQAVTYKNTDRNYAFTIPAGWALQSGDVNADDVLFMAVPFSKTCSFHVHMTPMQPDFPAEASVKASLDSAVQDMKRDKNLAAKRRDESGMENGKQVKFTRGWELTEKGQPGGHQRIIYQAYDRQNYYLNMMAAAATEHFEACRPTLQSIIDSIKFGN